MMFARSILLSALAAGFAAPQTALGSLADAELAVREGDGASALEALERDADSIPAADAAFWRGRALLLLGRPEAAVDALCQVPRNHRLYPYAARGLLYCAWRSPQQNFRAIVEPLISSPDAEVSELALAALAERVMHTSEKLDTEVYNRLKEKAKRSDTLQALIKLLEIRRFAMEGDFDGGIEYAKKLEQDSALPALMRQRVRLELAELYYCKEQAARANPTQAAEAVEGKGEETLLQFITANPDTPLLEKAFRRLSRHSGSGGSEYTRFKLEDWADDTAHPRRAALALYAMQQLAPTHGEAADSALANRAAAELPGEPLTRTILHEHIRKLLQTGRNAEAEQYLALLDPQRKDANARTIFLRAMALQGNPLSAAEGFIRSARSADSALLEPALENALICATQGEDAATVEQLLSEPRDEAMRRSLLLAHAGLTMLSDPTRARREIAEAAKLNPTPEQLTDIWLDEVQLDLLDAVPELIARRFSELHTVKKATWNRWIPEQILRYAALLEKAADAQHNADAAGVRAEALLYRMYEAAESLPIKEGLALRLAERLSASKRHEHAMELMLDLSQLQPGGEMKAITLFYAAQQASKIGSLRALEEAAKLYAECSRMSTNIAPRATIEQAAILVRINRVSEAFALLRSMEQMPHLTPADSAHRLTVMADAYGLDMTPENLAEAARLCEEIKTIPNLPSAWVSRANLQHAALCTRMGRHEAALADYLATLNAEKRRADAQDAHSCFIMYYAASGAVYQLLQMERYEEAATLADALGAWPGTPDAPAPTLGPKAEAFKRWAQSIRQTHFLPQQS